MASRKRGNGLDKRKFRTGHRFEVRIVSRCRLGLQRIHVPRDHAFNRKYNSLLGKGRWWVLSRLSAKE